MSPVRDAELVPAGSAGGGALRGTLYTLLAVALVAGALVRFNAPIAAVAPFVASLAAADTDASAANPAALLDLQVVPETTEPVAVAAIGLPPSEAEQLRAALKDRRVRLARLPLFDAGGTMAQGGDAGRSVLVQTAGFSQLVRLGREPVVVTLPIDRAGTIRFSTSAAEPVQIGAITIQGPIRLPEIASRQALDVGVAVE
ncbi:hypothetical protein NFI95_05650 [Acetobacteraceae bacterium KSS8]|uniref:Uncharacterized protein n=1 Tax=Endosaccharibacter trunci TaxID=2812733 RepID=A0ABT1W5B0_9PROT|nr:hypothetical protein [Acetobacteraceae bacterium KSS8]